MAAKRKSEGPYLLTLAADAVTVDLEIQQRAGGIDPQWADELSAVLAGGGRFHAAPVVFHDGFKYWLGSGFHRNSASDAANIPIDYEVRTGSRREAWLFALGDNSGRPRSGADIRKAIDSVLADPEFAKQYAAGQLSNRAISLLVCCSSSTVNSYLQEKENRKPDAAKASAGRMGNAVKVEAKKSAGGPQKSEPTPEKKEPGKDSLGRDIPACLRESWESLPGLCVCPACDGDGDLDRCPSCAGSGKIMDERAYFRLSPELREQAAQYGVPGPQLDSDRDGDDYTKRIEVLCRQLDGAIEEVVGLGRSPFSRWLHHESIGDQLRAARKALWQGRPLKPCRCRVNGGQPANDCRICGGCGRVSKVGASASEMD